ncbi:MAG: glycosyltransferase family 2 protein [Planctomycetales bacterium]|nr:glycosyltransferase family 2 protein [Planctomycetales bacterium]
MGEPLTSIVVCTFNRAAMLRDALSSLVAQQTDFEYEVVVVDNGSSDDTREAVDAIANETATPVRYFREDQRGVSWARNRGITEARGEWIAFCDDDQIADDNWLQMLMDFASEKGVLWAGGQVRLLMDDDELLSLPTECRGLLGESWGLAEPRRYAGKVTPGTGNLLVQKDVFARVGVFDTSLIEGGEDTDLFRRIDAAGIVGWYTPAAIVRHMVPPYRREPRYFLWASRRIGWQLAKREYRRWGGPILVLRLAARAAQCWLRFRPTLWRGCLLRSESQVLTGKCQVSRWTGYRDSALSLLLPTWFGSAERAASVDFSAEREMFGETVAPVARRTLGSGRPPVPSDSGSRKPSETTNQEVSI